MSSEDGVIAGSGAVGDRSRNHFETGSTWPVLSCFSPRAFQGISVYLHRVRLGLDSVSLLASDLPARRSFGWKFVHVVTQAMGSPNIPSLTINIQCCFFSLETQDWFFVGRMTCLFTCHAAYMCWLILSRPVSFPNLNSTSRNLMHCDWHSTTPGLKYYWLLALISGNNICAKQQEHWAADNNSKAISH